MIPPCHVRTLPGGSHLQARKEPSPDTEPDSPLILASQPPEAGEAKVCCLSTQSVSPET